MRNLTDIRVTDAIVHMVAPSTQLLECSTAPIVPEEGVTQFLVDHVQHGLADGRAVAAKFKVKGKDRVEGLSRSIIASRKSFIKDSSRIAGLLYAASLSHKGTDQRVSDGALVLARCLAQSASSRNHQFLALLKLDPGTGWRAVRRKSPHGELIVRLEVEQGILPSPRERLQKAAFVQHADSDTDLLVVDRQAGETVARFFLADFLGAEPALDSKQRTEKLYRALQNARDASAQDLNPTQYVRLSTYIDGAIQAEEADVDNIVATLPAPKAVKDRFRESLSHLIDRRFELDPNVTEKLLRRKRFRGDNNLRLTVDARFFGDMVTVSPPSSDEQFTITIRTREWQEQ